ncbi:MAG: ATP-dependent Clp protease ATP-binding subunit ClpA, partial [Bdellovibrionales bacterium RIFOXYB2_FULL_36_6]
MTSLKLEYIINEAIRKANKLRHEYLTIESILYVLLGDAFVERVLISCGADIEYIKSALNDFLNDDANFSILSDNEIENLGKNQFADEKVRQIARQNGVYYQPELTISLQRVLQRAALHVQSSGKNQILGIHLLVSIFGEEESYAIYLLKSMGIERLDIVQKLAHGEDHPLTDQEGDFISPDTGKKASALAAYTENLSEQVRSNKIDPIIGRKSEITRICQILCRRQKNNPLIIGDAGVGKTALAYGLAFAIEKKQVPEFLFDTDIYSLDMMSLISGAKYRGEFEGRFKDVLKELKKVCQSGKKAILFIDELHSIMGTGATTGGSLDASSLLKPALTGGEIRFMGSTTHEDYRKFIEKDHAFSRRFQNVEINEPQTDEAFLILKGLKSGFENHHRIEIPDNILKTALDLSIKYITDRKLPDKAIDIIDEAGAALQIREKFNPGAILEISDIEDTVAKMAKIPEVTVRSNEKEKLKNLEKNLSLLIFGQDKAISKVADTVLLARAGLGNNDKPVACFLFAGPTGVGKTELAKQLAFNLGIHFERIDMSEYMEKHSVSKLIGAPPGYIGHDQGGGRLTESIKKHPYAVLLLDEIEKAHYEVYNILLQIMDHGALSDSHG